jgi:hypothetical protein
MALNEYSGEMGAQNKSVKELNFRGRIDCDEARNGLQLQVESCEVKGVVAELIINGSSSAIQIFVHSRFKMAKVMFVKVEIFEICVEYMYE